MALRKQGMMSADIAMRMGMAERTVRHWLSRGTPYSRPRRQRTRLLDPDHAYLLQRWNQGCHNGSQLEAELRAKGYKGSQRAVYRYLATLEPSAFPREMPYSITEEPECFPHPTQSAEARCRSSR